MFRPGARLVYYSDIEAYQSAGAAAAPSWWAGADTAYDAAGAVDYAASLLDLTGHGNNATSPVSPGWANGTGWILNGTSQYVISPAILKSAGTIIVKYSATSTGARALFGANGNVGGTYYLVYPQVLAGSIQVYFGNSAPAVFSIGASVVLGLSARKIFVDGGFVATMAAATSSEAATAVYLGAFNNSGSAIQYLEGSISSVYIKDTVTSDADMATISAAMP